MTPFTSAAPRAFCISMESMGLAHPPPIARRETGVLTDALCGGGQGWGVVRAKEAIACAAALLSLKAARPPSLILPPCGLRRSHKRVVFDWRMIRASDSTPVRFSGALMGAGFCGDIRVSRRFERILEDIAGSGTWWFASLAGIGRGR